MSINVPISHDACSENKTEKYMYKENEILFMRTAYAYVKFNFVIN